jgi:hypothetical protein
MEYKGTDLMATGPGQLNQGISSQPNGSKQTATAQKRIYALHGPGSGAKAEERIFNITVVYEDAAAQQWARDRCEQRFTGVAKERNHFTWWKLGEFSEPAVLAGAVSKAMQADVIVVAIQSTEGFSLPFYIWVGSWLPHRAREGGTLMALISTPEEPGVQANRTADYLRAVAGRARMHFQVMERRLPLEAPTLPKDESQNKILTIAPARIKPPTALQRYAVRRWRLAA